MTEKNSTSILRVKFPLSYILFQIYTGLQE
jgi:hypothetical protein